MPPSPSPTHQLVDHALGGPGKLAQLVTTRRTEGVSWRKIANEVRDTTEIDVTHETLRGWFLEPVSAEAVSR